MHAQKEVLIVHLSGQIDAESVDLFRQACRGPLGGRPVLFHLGSLSFVGSTGLRPFLESLNDLTKEAGSDVHFCEVRNDFRQILMATPLGRRPCFENEKAGVESFRLEFVPVEASVQAPAPTPQDFVENSNDVFQAADFEEAPGSGPDAADGV